MKHNTWWATSGATLIGRTAIGIATIDVLRINHPDALAVRQVLLDL